MSASELPNEPNPALRQPSFEVVRVLHNDTDDEDGLFRHVKIVKTRDPHSVQVGSKDNWLESDYFLYVTYRIKRENHLKEMVTVTNTTLTACHEDGRPVPEAVLYRTPANLSVEEIMFLIGEI